MIECSVPSCFKRHYCKSFCLRHYTQIYRQNPKNYQDHLNFGKSPKGRAINKRAVRKYIKTKKGKLTRKRYQASGPGNLIHLQANAVYRNTFEGRMKRKLYGKNLSPFEQIRAIEAFKTFDGKCYCCGTTIPTRRGWHLDHKGDKFRGILCHYCNVAIAFLKDSVERCLLTETYLRRTAWVN